MATDGRVLSEALEEGVDQDDVPVRTRTPRTRAGDYRASVTVSEVRGGRYRYVDRSARIPGGR